MVGYIQHLPPTLTVPYNVHTQKNRYQDTKSVHRIQQTNRQTHYTAESFAAQHNHSHQTPCHLLQSSTNLHISHYSICENQVFKRPAKEAEAHSFTLEITLSAKISTWTGLAFFWLCSDPSNLVICPPVRPHAWIHSSTIISVEVELFVQAKGQRPPCFLRQVMVCFVNV